MTMDSPPPRDPSEALAGEALTRELLTLEVALAGRDFAALLDGPEALLDDGFFEFGASGRRWDRAATIDMLRDAPRSEVVIEDFAVELLAEAVALATYRLRPAHRDSQGRRSLRSSVWMQRESRWQMRFHHGSLTAD
jgi:hypothetical protein